METIIRIGAAVLVIPILYAAWIVTMSADVQGQVPTTTTIGCSLLPVIIDSHRCLKVVKGTPHVDPNTHVDLLVTEDHR